MEELCTKQGKVQHITTHFCQTNTTRHFSGKNHAYSLEIDWEKANINVTIYIKHYENIIKSVLKMKHHNYLKQFMVKLFKNNLYFKNITSKFSDSGILCNSCKKFPENRLHFFLCKIHSEIIQKLFSCFINLNLLKTAPSITPYFYNSTISINHPTNLIFISTIKYMYNLRFDEIVPNLPLIKSRISRFVSTSVEMYPHDNNWKLCKKNSH